MKLAERKLAELRGKLSSFDADFLHWSELAENGRELEKHATQVQRLGSALRPQRDAIETAMNALKTPDAVLAASAGFEADILDLHRVWGFFRRKFALRRVPGFHDHLEAMDEFAWRLYRPAIERAVAANKLQLAAVKEPPLVYFEDSVIPSAITRSRMSYLYDAARHAPKAESLVALMKAMPFPVVGVPWSYSQHLPSASLLAHEVGHCVERDLALEPVLDTLVGSTVAPTRKAAWLAWRSEVFADVFATVVLGPAFAWTLADLLANDPATIKTEKRFSASWTEYPTAALRIALVRETLKQQEHVTAANDLARDWKAAYSEHAMQEYEADVPKVVDAIRKGNYPVLGGTLADCVGFTADEQSAAQKACDTVLAPLPGALAGDVPVLFAVATLTFVQNPKLHAERKIDQKVVDKVLALRSPGVRSRFVGAAAPPSQQRAEDRARGGQLFDALRLARAAAEREPEPAQEGDATFHSEGASGGSTGGADFLEDGTKSAHGAVETEAPE